MSTLNSGRVLRVTNEFPQPQDTVVSWYSGWIPSFIVDKSLRSERVSEVDRVGPIVITKPQILATFGLFGKGHKTRPVLVKIGPNSQVEDHPGAKFGEWLLDGRGPSFRQAD